MPDKNAPLTTLVVTMFLVQTGLTVRGKLTQTTKQLLQAGRIGRRLNSRCFQQKLLRLVPQGLYAHTTRQTFEQVMSQMGVLHPDGLEQECCGGLSHGQAAIPPVMRHRLAAENELLWNPDPEIRTAARAFGRETVTMLENFARGLVAQGHQGQVLAVACGAAPRWALACAEKLYQMDDEFSGIYCGYLLQPNHVLQVSLYVHADGSVGMSEPENLGDLAGYPEIYIDP